VNVDVSDSLKASFYVIGDSIIYAIPEGRADLEGARGSLAIGAEVADYVDEKVGKYVQVADYSRMAGATQEAREYFTTTITARQGIQALLFCNLTLPMQIAVKINNRFNHTGKPVFVERNYSDAINRAIELCGEMGVGLEHVDVEPSIRIPGPVQSLKPLSLRTETEWEIHTPELSVRPLVINNDILLSITEGDLEVKHLPLIAQLREQCRAALPEGHELEYIVVDSTRVGGGKAAGRVMFMQQLREWHQQHPLRMYITFGANTFMRTAMGLGDRILPFKVRVADDFKDTLEMIERDKGGTDRTSGVADPMALRSDATREQIDQLLEYLAGVNWTRDGIDSNLEVGEDHPLFLHFQSIKLIKEEFDNLFSERTKAVEDLKVSNAQLQEAVSELKNAQDGLVQQERLAAVGQLAAGIAHDFNNLLTGIMGSAELLNISHDTTDEAKAGLSQIISAAEHGAQLVRQLLDFSRRSIRQTNVFRLDSHMEESVRFIERTIPENIKITLEIQPGHYLVEADSFQLRQMLTNLAVNSSDAMADGGGLSIRLSHFEGSSQHICSQCGEQLNDKWILLCVSDTGCGIPPDVMDRVFEPFFTTKEVGKGTGLGLSQVFGIIHQHGGHIDVQSVVGEGTTFNIYLRPTAHNRLSPPMGIRREELRGNGETILLVEDEPAVLDAMEAMLDHMGYEVLTASNGLEAVDAFKERNGDVALVLTDMVMPDMAGDELYDALVEEAPNTKMVMMSGYPLGSKGADLLEKGIVDWFEKPVTYGDLSSIVSKALSPEP